jgi:hypothetical protein
MANDETRLTEELEKLLELRKGIENELEQFNKKMEDVLGGDTRSMYFGPSHLFEDYLIKWIMRNLNESRDGAEWFLYDAMNTISHGEGNVVEASGRKFLITTPSEYVHMCFELNMKADADENSGRK